MKLRWMALTAGISLLSVGVTRADWAPRAPVIESRGNLTLTTPWNPGQGLHLRLASADTNQPVLDVDLKNGDSRMRFVPETEATAALLKASQLNPQVLPLEPRTNLVLVLKIRPEAWSLYCEGRRLAWMPPPFALPLTVLQPAESIPAASNRNDRFQKVADFRFEDSFMRPEEDEYPLGEWEPESGKWYLYTALDTVRDNKTLRADAKRTLKADFSPNFYSLATSDNGASITSGYDFYDNYTYEAGLRTDSGEMGLLFYCQENGACHGYTIRMTNNAEEATLSLWSCSSTNRMQRTVLGEQRVKLTDGQWVKLGVKIVENRIQCFLDRVKVLDLPADLPPGGRFGLYADSPVEIRFDDVAAASTHDLDFRNVADLRRYTMMEKGSILPRRRWLRPPSLETELTRLEPSVSREAQWLAVGAPSHGPHVFSAAFDTPDLPAAVGLLGGFVQAGLPHYRFVCRRTRTDDQFTLERVTGSAAKILEGFRLPVRKGELRSERVDLMFDASNENEWRFYCNGRLVLVHVPAPELVGGSGLFVDARTRTRISMPAYQFKRDDLFLNRFEKNSKFAEDPFMRHWASPEGQWLEETNKLTWYTGDFFGRYSLRMPYTNQSQIHLGVGEDGTNGELVVSMRDDALFLSPGTESGTSVTVLARSATNSLAVDGDAKWYAVHSEDHWLWATSGDKLLFKHSLAEPLRGRRIRVSGFTTDQLKLTHVDRYNVKDFLFTESLFDWVINGGRWEIINRFQCDPRWSHMNGEGTNAMAALWAKVDIKGDFCVEMYAGQRMGWYERCGDLNMTVMNSTTTPSQGYTITCTGWDPDHSQRLTRLYRNGVVIAESDKYLVPRKREGNKRFGYEPLVAAGRDVHGAWYYLKLRRIGKKLEFYFDNELVFTATDDRPIEGGMAGIWTFLNSMMVARVKVAAEEIRPHAPALVETAGAVPAVPEMGPVVLRDGKPLALCLPRYWEADDDVGLMRMEWHPEPDGANWFSTRNIQGSGSMQARCSLPPVRYDALAGWQFEVRRTPGARFDFHFAVGRTNAAGLFVPEQRFVNRLSGADLPKGELISVGSNRLEYAPGWTPVTVWLPNTWPAKQADPSYVVKVEGFGLLQPSLDVQGLTGNAPGDGYAVRGFTELTYSTPSLSLDTNQALPSAFVLTEVGSGRKIGTFNSITSLQSWVEAPSSTGLIRVAVSTAGPKPASAGILAWIRLPDQPAIQCAWHDRLPDTVVFRTPDSYPDRRFQNASLLLNGIEQKAITESFASRVVPVPRDDLYTSSTVTASASFPGLSNAFTLAWKNNTNPFGPVLLSLEGLTPFYQNGESRQLPGMAVPISAWVPAIQQDLSGQGSFLAVRNTLQTPRLRTVMPVSLSLAKFPLFQFRYRTPDPMARVSMNLGSARFVKISETHPPAQVVRNSTNFVFDNTWHTWMGQVSDAMSSQNFDARSSLVANPELASANGIDQTGRFSQMDLDDLVFGPAVSKADQLALTPKYFDYSGIESVSMAVRQGAEPYSELSPKQVSDLAWQAIPNGARSVPDLKGITDGLGHLFLKARSKNGKESAVSDVPFLLDRSPMQASFAFGSPDVTTREGATLRMTLNTGGAAPMDPETLKIKWNDKEATGMLRSASLVHQPTVSTLSFTWPQLFSKQLKETVNGQKVTLTLTGLQDGAGNASADLSVPLVIDYAKDKTPPVVTHVVFPTNVGYKTGWELESGRNPLFVPRAGTTLEMIGTTNEPAFLRVKTGAEGSIALKFEKEMNVQAMPNVAFRLRRPMLNPTNDTVNLILTVDLSTNSLTVPLVVRKANPKFTTLEVPPVWTSNAWSSIFLNVWQEATQRGFAATNLTIQGLTIRQTGPEPEGVFDVNSLFVYGYGTQKEQLRINAYDASGMDTPQWNYETVAGQTLDSAAFLGNPAPTAVPPHGWVVLRERDKAGNATLPIRAPVWSVHPPIGVP